MKTDIYQSVTDKIIANLESGTVPWLKPWKDSRKGLACFPHNAVTGRQYNGINWLLLGGDYEQNGWLTYKQAQELGGSVKKGEKGTEIVFWQFTKVIDKETGKEKSIPFAKHYYVFNLGQCEGIDAGKIKTPQAPESGNTTINQIAERNNVTVKHGGNRAFYALKDDFVMVPSVDLFKSESHYSATLAHELTHWTGPRLEREFGKRFGDSAYAFEELVAEIGSAFICAQTGIESTELQHADYLASWLSVLKADNRAIFTAASKAKQAAEFLLGQSALSGQSAE